MSLLFDLKYAWRLLRKSWGYSLMCASVVALSVGFAVWIFTFTYSLLWKSLPFAARWYSVQITADGTDTAAQPRVDLYTYQEILAHKRVADHLGAFENRVAVLSEGEATTSLRAAAISPRLFAATGVAPRLGRMFQESDGQSDAAPVAILSDDSWRNYFAADPAIIGRTVRLDATPVQIVGVMPKGFFAFEDFELWVPLHIPKLARPGDSARKVAPMIALGEKQSLDSVLNEMKTAVDRGNRDYPTVFGATRRVAIFTAPRMYTHPDAPLVSMLGLMAAAVSLLGCVNISMVFLARLLERSRELALRSALGASRSRLLRQCLLETALVVLVGLVAGYGLAAMGIRWARGVADFMSQVQGMGRPGYVPELRMADFGAAVLFAVVIWMLSTLIPAWRISKQDAAVVLAGGGKGGLRGSNKSVSFLVGVQVVISCVVLVVCANVITAVDQEVNKPIGVNTSQIILSTVPTVFGERYPDATRRLRYWEDLTAAIQSRIPGADVAFATAPPTKPATVPALIETRPGADRQGTPTIPVAVVSENYFKLLGLTLRSGRLFETTDNSESLKVAVVDEKMAARHWPDGKVLGQRIQLNPAEKGPWLTIVGVVSSVAGRPYAGEGDGGLLYQPLRQAVPPAFQLLVRVPDGNTTAARQGTSQDGVQSDAFISGKQKELAGRRPVLRAGAFAVDRDLPLHNLQTLDTYLAALWTDAGALVPVMIAISLITALLAASGLFGLISRSVAQRTQEVGIRRALGATPWRATSMFLRQGAIYLAVAIVSVGLGIMAMPALSAAITNIFDRVVLATLSVVLLIVSVIVAAAYLPTRRAVALEPGDALRYD